MISKIHLLSELEEIAAKLKKAGKVVVHCHGTFDLMHPGHIKHFEAAKKQGDILIITVTADRFVKKGIGRPVFRDHLRAESIAALACVDYVAIDPHENAEEAIRAVKPDIFIKGGDYEGKENQEGHPTWQEKKIAEEFGGRIHFTHEPVTFSSTALLNDYFSPFPESTKEFLSAIRAHCPTDEFVRIFDKIRKLQVLVIGDAILDVYHYCTFLGRSVKEEIPRVKVKGSEMFLGGSLAVANTLAGFCDSVDIAAVLGKNDSLQKEGHEDFIRDHLKANVVPHFFYRDGAPTTVNERFVNEEPNLASEKTKVYLRKYFGLYRINEELLSERLAKEIAAELEKIIPKYDIVLVTDYGLGMLGNELIRTICKNSNFFGVNTQTNSINFGFNLITKYPRADYVSISLPEIQLALHDKHSDVQHLAAKVVKIVRAKAVTVTLGASGALMRDHSSDIRIPVLSTNVIDRIGAGDAFLALSTLGAYLRLPMALSGFLGGVASALSCSIVANKETVDRTMLMRSIHTLLKSVSATQRSLGYTLSRSSLVSRRSHRKGRAKTVRKV